MTSDEVINHDREWIIGCIKHDGFIKTDRFDKANQIILDALATKDSCTEPTTRERKEAKSTLLTLKHLFEDEQILKALDVAISALSVIEQTKWERDTALATLEEHGIGLGQIAEPEKNW